MKKYEANTAVGLSVGLRGGGSTRVTFSELSDGRSVYYTDDAEIAWGLEHHYKFGSLFRLAEDTARSTSEHGKGAKAAARGSANGRKSGEGKNPRGASGHRGGTQDVSLSHATSGEDLGDTTLEKSVSDFTPETGMIEVAVTDMDAAKDYLAERFGVVRTKLKSEEIIKETASGFGIEFKFPE